MDRKQPEWIHSTAAQELSDKRDLGRGSPLLEERIKCPAGGRLMLEHAIKILAVCFYLGIGSDTFGKSFVIDFSKEAVLARVFDSGLRPHRQRGAERLQCEVSDVPVGFILPGDVEISPIKSDRVTIDVLKGGLIPRLEIKTDPVSLRQAEQIMLSLCNLLGKPKNRFISWLDAVRHDPIFFEEDFGIGTTGVESPAISAFFLRSGLKDRPLRFGLTLTWKYPGEKQFEYSDNPIPPPPGYEHVPMEPPLFKSSGELASEKAAAGAVEVSPDDEKSRGKEENAGGTSESSSQIWLIALGAVLVAGTLSGGSDREH